MSMSQRTCPLLLVAALLLGLPAREARAQRYDYPASGFMIQALLGGSAIIASNNDLSPFLLVPSLRIGGMLRPLAIAGNITYYSNATFRNGYNGFNVLTVGPDVMPFVWQSTEGHARLYLLFGFNFGAAFVTNQDASLTGGLSFGVGGHYFIGRHFALGVEIGSKTQFYELQGRTSPGDVQAVSSLYAALSGTFVVGH